MRMSRIPVWAVCFLISGMLSSRAATIFVDDWGVTGSSHTEGWAAKKEDGTAPAYGSITQPADNIDSTGVAGLMITRTPVGAVEKDYIYGDAPLIGSWKNLGGTGKEVRSIYFDFYSKAGGGVGHEYPAGLRLYFRSTGGNVWYYNFNPPQLTSGWGSYGVDIYSSYRDAWWSPTGTDIQWVTDFQNVSEVGIWLAYQGTDYPSQIYGIDDFELNDEHLPIPEPSAYLLIAMVLLSLGLAFRDQLNESLALVRRLVKA